MVDITVGEQTLAYERQAQNRSEDVYEVMMVVESRTGELSVRQFEMDVSGRGDLSADRLESALAEWLDDHQGATIEKVVVREVNRCGYATAVEDPDADGDTREQPLLRGGSSAQPQYQAQVGFGSVDVDKGDEVEFHVAGPDTSVYGTSTGTVTGVKTGTDEYNVLIIETDSGTKRVREDWLVGHGDDEDEDDES